MSNPTWRSSLSAPAIRHHMERLELGLISVAFTWWMLPVGFGLKLNLTARLASVFPLALVCLWRLLSDPPRQSAGRSWLATALVTTYSLLWIQALLRTASRGLIPGALVVEALYIIAYLTFLVSYGLLLFLALRAREGNRDGLSRVRFHALLGLAIYVAANLVGYVLGLRQQEVMYLAEYKAQLLGLAGVQWFRTLFPFAEGINWMGIVAGAALVSILPFLRRTERRPRRVISLVTIVASLITLVAVDSRWAILSAMAVLFLALLPRPFSRFTRWAPLAVSTLPIVLSIAAPRGFGLLGSMERDPGLMDPALKRELTASLCDGQPLIEAPLSNRPLIWDAVIAELRRPATDHLFGAGFRGQAVSGLSQEWSCLFLSQANRHLTTAHNLWLQSTISIGYIGAATTLALLVWLILRLSLHSVPGGDPAFHGLLLAVQYVLLVGALESTLDPDSTGTFLIFLIAAISSAQGAMVTRLGERGEARA